MADGNQFYVSQMQIEKKCPKKTNVELKGMKAYIYVSFHVLYAKYSNLMQTKFDEVERNNQKVKYVHN